MDARYTAEERAFRAEVRAFIAGALPEAIRSKIVEGRTLAKEDLVSWTRVLDARGWAAPHWPVEWGGQDWTDLQRHLWHEEMQRAGVPIPLAFNASMIACASASNCAAESGSTGITWASTLFLKASSWLIATAGWLRSIEANAARSEDNKGCGRSPFSAS